MEIRKQIPTPSESGYYWCKVNPAKHPQPDQKYYDAYDYFRKDPIPIYVYKNWNGSMYIETDTEAENTSFAEDYLWYGPVTPIIIEE